MATIQGVYVALFGRPADPTGLAFFDAATNGGKNLNAIGDLASTQEYKDRFKDQSNVQIVNAIYQSLFNRDAEAAGLNFFVDALNKGTLNIKNIAIAILDGAQGDDKTTSDNKIKAADAFTKAIDTPVEVGAYTGNTAAASGRTFLASVTKDAATIPSAAAVDKAVADVSSATTAGVTLAAADVSLTSTVSPTATDAKLKTTSNDDTINVAAPAASHATNPAIASTDTIGSIDGGFGNDTVKLSTKGENGATTTSGKNGSIGATGAAVTPTLTNVEKLFITAVGGDGGTTGNGGNGNVFIDVTKSTSLKEVWNDSSVAGKAGTDATTPGNAGTATVSVSNIALSTAVGLKGTISGGATTFVFKDAEGSSDSASLALNATSASATAAVAATIDKIETLNVSNTGTSNVNLALDATKVVNVSGSGSLTFAVSSTTPVVETVNAATYTGAFTADVKGFGALKTVTGGTGADTITIDTSHTNDVTINLGAGNDTLKILRDTTPSNKAITVTLGTGSDIVEIGATGATLKNVAGTAGNAVSSAAELVKSLVTITDFDKAADAIKLGGFNATTGQDKLLKAELDAIADTTANTDLLAAVNKAASFTDEGKFSIFTYAGATYIYGDTNNASAGGATLAALTSGDTLVKITGITDADLTATNFQIVA